MILIILPFSFFEYFPKDSYMSKNVVSKNEANDNSCFLFIKKKIIQKLLILFRTRGGRKGPPTSFSPVTSTNVGISPQNFLTFSFNLFDTLVKNVKFLPSVSPKLLNLNQDHSSKIVVFLVKSL